MNDAGRALGIVAATLAFHSGNALAQSAATRPIRVLVASAPGGPSDIQIRLLVPALTAAFGQTIIVDNRPSNNGVVATEIAARSPPDGHTFTVGNSGTHAVNATLYAKLPYDPVRDFVAVTEFSTTGMVVAANARLPGTSIHDLVTLARKQPGILNVAIAGATGQLAGDALWAQLQLKMTNIHYKGSAPSELALVSGEADLSILTPLATLTHLHTGRLKAYGITSAQRSPVLPDVPTLMEQGVQGFDIQFWNGLFAPAKTPAASVRTAQRAIAQALQTPETGERFRQLGLQVVGNTPEEFAAIVKNDVEKFRRIIIESGIPRL
ncbi:MAG: tripartite tricarboxylate transporter substrate-binding protein [Betaproteobacteria bacterium]